MKRINSLLVLLFLLAGLSAQQLTNAGFENFEKDQLNGDGVRPTGWNASNVIKQGSITVSGGKLIFEEANGRTGKCVGMKSAEVGALGITEPAPAWVTLGQPWAYLDGIKKETATAGTDGGILFTYRPDTLAVWIKRTYSTREDANIVVYSWKETSTGISYAAKGGGCTSTTHTDEESDIRQKFDKNSCVTTQHATQIAEGSWRSSEQFTDWTEVKIPIQYLTNDKPEKLNVIISGNNYPNFRDPNVSAGAVLYADDLRFIYSSAIQEVYFDNKQWNDFDPDRGTEEQICAIGSKPLPQEITVKRSGRYLDPSEYTISMGAIDEVTTITVRAEDGSSTSTYRIKFVGELSKNPRPAEILVGGVSIPNFNSYLSSQTFELPFGTTTVPEITITPADDGQTFTVSYPASLPGTAILTVTSPDGAYTQTYNIDLKVGALKDNTLTDIRVNGKSITGFKPTTNMYVVQLPTGTTDPLTIDYTTAYPDHHIVDVDNKGISGGATIKVTPLGSTDTRTYTLRFVVTKSTYSYLSSIMLDGKEIDGFAPETTTYDINLPLGTESLPEITWTQGDEYQTVNISEGGLNGNTKITVTAESGDKSVYTLRFDTKLSSVNTLSMIYIDGEPLAGFAPDVKSYEISLPIGVTTVPKITYDRGDEYQTVDLKLGDISASTYIIVTAQDGSAASYILKFTVQKASNSKLDDILVGGVSIEGFDPEVTRYDILLPRGTTELPEITWTAADEYQTVTLVKGTIGGDTRITVKAQSGAVTTYILHFEIETNSNTSLLGIAVGGSALDDFASDKYEYSYELPGGTTELPEITYTKADAAQRVYLTLGGVSGRTTLLVVAEDGSRRTYSIDFSVAKSENALLRMIYIGGEALTGFDPETFAYSFEISSSAQRCPAVTVDKYPGQSVVVVTPQLTGEVRIEVTPEVGDKNVYTVDIHYPMSDYAYLDDITVGGQSLTGFRPELLEYSIRLPKGTERLPKVGYTRYERNQKVYIAEGGINGTTVISVCAESGDTVNYRLHFSVAQSSASTLDGISVGGVPLDGFAPDRLFYAYELSQDMTQAPSVTWSASAGQQVQLTQPDTEGQARLVVYAEDRTDTTFYTIDMAYRRSSEALLGEILLDGTPLVDIDRDTIYVDLAVGQDVPVLTFTKGAHNQYVAVADAGLEGVELLVVAEDGTTRRYVIRYRVPASDDASLSGIRLYVGNEWMPLPDFSADRLDYTYPLAWRSGVVPVIDPLTSDDAQTVRIDYGKVNASTTVTVTAADGITERVYTISFPTEKSDISTLSMIYVDGKELEGFTPATTDYTVSLARTVRTVPAITWDNALIDGITPVTEQRVIYRSGSVDSLSTLTVYAENGDATVYRIRYQYRPVDEAHGLSAIEVNGTAISGFRSDSLSYRFELDYGTKSMPEVKAITKYDEQQVITTITGGVDGRALVQVISDDDARTSVTYTIDFEVGINPAHLTAVSVTNGTLSTPFTPEQTVYIVTTDAVTPVIECTAADGYTAKVAVSNANKHIVEVSDPTALDGEVVTYSFFFHYTNDTIPNASFDEWGTAKYNNAAKPTGWTVPADAFESYKVTGTYYSGVEVNKIEPGIVKLSTYWKTGGMFGGEGNGFSIAGSIPGMMTLGTMSISPASGGKTTSSVGGNIQFRNSPDVVKLDYLSVANNNVPNWRMLVTVGDESSTVDNLLTGDYDDKSNWRVALDTITYGELSEMKNINITVNAAHTEQANQLGGTGISYKSSELHVDNLRLLYSNRLTSISVDGVALPGFASDIFAYNVTLDSDYQGTPVIDMVGEVIDQEHRIVWSQESEDGIRTATIHSVAEDGQEQSYIITFSRVKSSNSSLAAVFVGDQPLTDFDPATTDYTIEVENDRILPAIRCVAGSEHQSVTVTASSDDKVVVEVVSETGDTRTYTFTFAERRDAVTALTALTVGDYDLQFSPDRYTYLVSLDDATALPHVSFVKSNDNQTVTLDFVADSVLLDVIAADASDTARYVVTLEHPAVPLTSTITALAVNDESIFVADRFEYNYDNTSGDRLAWTFERGSLLDSVSQTLTADSMVISVSGDRLNHYVVHITTAQTVDLALSSLQIDGRQLDEFNPSLKDYTYGIEKGDYPSLSAHISGGAHLTVGYDAAGGKFVYTASAPDDTQSVTTLLFENKKNTDATLADILIDGRSLTASTDSYTSSSAFDPETLYYDITLASASPKTVQPAVPVISVVSGAYGQQIDILQGTLSSPATVTVRSESGQENTYTLTFSASLSSEVRLADIAVDFVSLPDFDPETLDYTCALDQVNATPKVSYRQTDPFQRVDVLTEQGRTTLTVTAEDGTPRQYTIDYEVSRSDIATLSGINLDGISMDGFAADLFEYEVLLPVGTTAIPQIVAVKGEDGQSIAIDTKGVNDTTTITVTAEDGITSAQYKIRFTRTPSTCNTLGMISLNYLPLQASGDGYTSSSAFDAETLDYTVTLAVGVEIDPEVTYLPADDFQTVTRTVDTDGTVTLTVTAEDGTERRYTITFTHLLSDNALLSAIYIDGLPLATFNPSLFDYHHTLSVEAETAPTVTYDSGDRWQTVQITPAATVNDTAIIAVLAGDATTTATYRVIFDREQSDNADLLSISIDGVPMMDFSSGQRIYNYVLPQGTTHLPDITWETADARQTVDTVSGGISGAYIITVTAENGDQTSYIINFSVERSHNALLSDISVAGTTINGFDPEIFDYHHTLPYGTTAAPLISFTAAEPYKQKITYTPALTPADTAHLTVVAEDDLTHHTYTITFSVTPSDNALLDEIRLGGELIATTAATFTADRNFASDEFTYFITLPYGTTAVPEITWQGQVPDYTSITATTHADIHGSDTITVTSQDGMFINQYILNFTVSLSDNALLSDLQVGDNLLRKFDPEQMEYTITLPVGTDTASLPTTADVTYTRQMDSQTVTLTQTRPEEIIITVTAEDGTTINVYVLHFEIELSTNSLLADIIVGGMSISNFSPTQYDYTYLLFPGAQVPTLEGIKSESRQEVFVTMGAVNEISYIYCVAEDGTETEYRISFNTTDINPGEQPSMDDVAWTPLGDGNFQASTIRDNVRVLIFLPSGLLLRNEKVGLVDPNEDIKYQHTGGTVLHFDRRGQTYLYVFVYNNIVVRSGKFIY